MARDERLVNIVVAALFAALGLLWIVVASEIPARQTISQVSPGFLPVVAGVLVLGIATAIVVQHLRMRTDPAATPMFDRRGEVRVAIAIVAMGVYVALLTVVHYFLSTFALMVVTLMLFGQPIGLRLVAYAAAIAFALFAIFVFFLQLTLPGSRFG